MDRTGKFMLQQAHPDSRFQGISQSFLLNFTLKTLKNIQIKGHSACWCTSMWPHLPTGCEVVEQAQCHALGGWSQCWGAGASNPLHSDCKGYTTMYAWDIIQYHLICFKYLRAHCTSYNQVPTKSYLKPKETTNQVLQCNIELSKETN